MNQRVLIRSITLMCITFIGIMIFWFTNKPQPAQYPDAPTLLDTDNPYSSLFIPAFNLIDAAGNAIDQSILDDQYTLVDFFYTSCPLICPGMTAAMKQVYHATANTNLNLLSISIDPEVDTPQVIANYAKTLDIDESRWRFITGDIETLDFILMGLGFEIGAPNPDKAYRDISHPSTLILLGPDRHVIALYRYTDPEELQKLIKKAHELAG